jgi:4-cresol dehydrogenase (hydroxylating) flavoprotein subunit
MASKELPIVSSAKKQRILPPSFDDTTFDKALDSIADCVGSKNVSRDASYGSLEGPQGQLSYGDVWPMRDPDQHLPSGAIRPATVDELQCVLKIANEYKLPLWTTSRGRNLG